MIEDCSLSITKCSGAALQSALSLPDGFDADVSQHLLLRHLIDHLNNSGEFMIAFALSESCAFTNLYPSLSVMFSSGGDRAGMCIQLWMQRSCSDQPTTNTAIKHLGRCVVTVREFTSL
jgi:hypothetical protein